MASISDTTETIPTNDQSARHIDGIASKIQRPAAYGSRIGTKGASGDRQRAFIEDRAAVIVSRIGAKGAGGDLQCADIVDRAAEIPLIAIEGAAGDRQCAEIEDRAALIAKPLTERN